ncbi:phage holin family protein [Cellulomonas alba]|uniref:Phage holin family protein n=1 Tax=Cellulomonas alba TaxID=3053467 RepID=A0ABT7SCC7_9CELL|nr:phage holin family protein [Cellulomonas alba]MDM7853838.1 phage holin family protein [Cellulomonas alba]
MTAGPDPVAPGRTTTSSASTGELFGAVTRDLSTLIRQEIELAKAEATQSARNAGRGVGMFGGAGVAVHLALIFVSLALWWALGDPVGLGWSGVIVAVLWAIVAAVLALRGRTELRRVQGLPRTADTVKKIPHALQGHEEENS